MLTRSAARAIPGTSCSAGGELGVEAIHLRPAGRLYSQDSHEICLSESTAAFRAHFPSRIGVC